MIFCVYRVVSFSVGTLPYSCLGERLNKLNQMYGDCFSFQEFNMIKLIRIQFEVVHKMTVRIL